MSTHTIARTIILLLKSCITVNKITFKLRKTSFYPKDSSNEFLELSEKEITNTVFKIHVYVIDGFVDNRL